MRLRFLHLLIWFLIFYILWAGAIDYFASRPFFDDQSFTFQKIVLRVTSVTSFFLYPLSICIWFGKFLPGKIVRALLMCLFCIPVIIFIRYCLEEILCVAVFGFGNYFPPFSAKYYFQDNLYFAVLFSCFGLAYFFVGYTGMSERRQAALAFAAKESELAFLKSQINPHFLFNTLNSIYTLIYKKNDNALFATEKLSSLLRYALYEEKGAVELETEITHLKDYIELQRLRVDDAVVINMDIENIDGSLQISPHLLISLAENAFKHGDFSDPAMPLTITAFTEGNNLVFSIKNKKANRPVMHGGIGLQNIKRRLELLYENRHTFSVAESDNQFSITLSIAL
ncbi:sensor histidine kinase [Nostoc ellipsosporum NOK]|nr:sensor histidine kinase [Nostoc ellipsosporum NOK]